MRRRRIITLGQLIDAYLIARHGRRASEAKTLTRAKLKVLPLCWGTDELHVAGLGKPHVRHFIEWYQFLRGFWYSRCPFTLTAELHALRGMFAWAMAEGHAQHNPFSKRRRAGQ